MDSKELQELQDPETWDFEQAERVPGGKAPRAVVSVAFSRPDFERVTHAAERAGQRTSEFIRRAVLEKTSLQPEVTYLAVSGSLGAQFITRIATTQTKGSGPSAAVREEKPQAVTAS